MNRDKLRRSLLIVNNISQRNPDDYNSKTRLSINDNTGMALSNFLSKSTDDHIDITVSSIDHNNIIERSQVISENIAMSATIPTVDGDPILEVLQSKSDPETFILGNKDAKFPKIKKYTLEIFLERAFIIHGNIYDYSAIKGETIKNNNSLITIICKLCYHTWSPAIRGHITQKTGCPSCAGVLRNTYENFLSKAKKLFDDLYTFNRITFTSEGSDTLISSECNKCKDFCIMSIASFIESRKRNGCPGCKRLTPRKLFPWTYERLIREASQIHGTHFDYSQINPLDITSKDSILRIVCNKCGYNLTPTIDCHIYGKNGCASCNKKLHWNYDRFILESKRLYGDKYNYDKIIPNEITGASCEITISCTICDHEWPSTIMKHITRKIGCGMCSGRIRYTYDLFITRAHNIHGNKYNYEKIVPAQITSSKSVITIICKTCDYEWPSCVKNHIGTKSGCKQCAGKLPYTYEIFIKRAQEIHGNKYNYEATIPSMITCIRSSIIISCNKCNYIWPSTIENHITRRCGCTKCAHRSPLTYDIFMEKVTAMYGDKRDYSKVTPDDIENCNSIIVISCTKCNYEWPCKIRNHIDVKRSCRNCIGRVPYTYERFINKAISIHGDRYNYNKIIQSQVHGTDSIVPIICNQCNYEWPVSIDNHIYSRSGCPICRSSKGELKCAQSFKELRIAFVPKFRIPVYKQKEYDFLFEWNGIKYILEYDGIQHHKNNSYFHRTPDAFADTQKNDHDFTILALNQGYRVIRIDYTNIKNISRHIVTAVNSGKILYYSDDALYSHLPPAF